MRVSVLINNYNYGRFLPYCIESVLQQTRPPDEIIVYDDGSVDDSVSVLQPWAKHLTLIEAENFGQSPAFNQANAIYQAFLQSTGDVLCLLDSDDAFLSKKIQSIVDAFEADKNAIMVQHPFFEIDASNNRTGVIRPLLKSVDPATYVVKTHNLVGLFSQTSGLSFRRRYLEVVLPITPDAYEKIWSDVRLSRQALFFDRIGTIFEALGEYRIHGDNDSDKLQDHDYFCSVMSQMYAFFNEAALAHGRIQIELKKSVNRMDLKSFRKAAFVLSSREPFWEKSRILRGMLKSVASKLLPRGR